MPRRRRKSARRPSDYHPTPIPGLVLHPTILLLNLIVRTADDNTKTDGKIPLETVDVVTSLIRHTYDFPDLDLARGKGVAISFVNQFFHPDDYTEHRVARVHSQGLLNVLQGTLEPQPLLVPELRTSNVRDPGKLAGRRKRVLAFWYKQRFLSICFVGEEAQLDRLRGDTPAELLNQILGTIWQGVGLSQEAHVIPHPAFVPAALVRKVSRQNAIEWAEQMKQWMSKTVERGTQAEIAVVGPPGPSYTVRPRKWKR
jgi:hypothetical protein